MKTPLVVAILVICAVPLHAQGQRPDMAKLKANAQNIVSIIKGDRARIQAYCEINVLGERMGEANQKQDEKEAEAISKQVTELEKKLGPEYVALSNDLDDMDLDSPEGREIESILAPLDDSCPH
jgi:hypothetical protein